MDEDTGTRAVDEALEALARLDLRKHAVLELRFFRALSVEETARTLGIPAAHVLLEQRLAQAWLRRELAGRREACDVRDAATSRSGSTPSVRCSRRRS